MTETFRIGPLDLAPEGEWGDQSSGWRSDLPRPEGDFGIKTVDFDIVDADGNPVPREDAHLHHIVMGTSARNDTYCPGGERFAGAGAERNPIRLPDPYAYLVGSSDRWSATWHVMNTSDQRQEAYIEYEIGYQPDADEENSRGVTAFFLDVTGCFAEYDVPGDGGPDSVHTETRTWTAPWDGTLVNAVGHMHGGGIDITIRNEETGDECTMNAIYPEGGSHGHDGGDMDHDDGDTGGHGHAEPPHEITGCPVHHEFDEGDEFSVISRYDNSQPVDGAMGIVRAYAWDGHQ